MAETLPVDDGWADAVISNGVIDLCADELAVSGEIHRAREPGGWLQVADIADGRSVPPEARRDIDLWTGGIAGGLPRAGWQEVLEDVGFIDVQVGPAADTFGGAGGEGEARAYEVDGDALLAREPTSP